MDGTGQEVGGGRGIRTLDTRKRIHAFQACAFSHSATPPQGPTKNIWQGRQANRGDGAAQRNYSLKAQPL
jgi:hypothetical protein